MVTPRELRKRQKKMDPKLKARIDAVPAEGRLTLYNPTDKPISEVVCNDRVRIPAQGSALVDTKRIRLLMATHPEVTLSHPSGMRPHAAYSAEQMKATEDLSEVQIRAFLLALMRGETPEVPAAQGPTKDATKNDEKPKK